MNNPSTSISGIIIAIISILLVIGALVTALAQTGTPAAPGDSSTITPILVNTEEIQSTHSPTNRTDTPIPDEPSSAETEVAINTITLEPSETQVTQPTSAGTFPTATMCVIPATWIEYTVKSGDTLYSIATKYQTTFRTLQAGNCLGGSTRIYTGQVLYVPNNPTITPTRTKRPPKTLTPTMTNTPKPSSTPTFTPTQTPTFTPTQTPTNTSSPPTDTYTPIPTDTDTPTP